MRAPLMWPRVCEHTCIDHACTFVGNQTPLYLIHNMGLWLIMWKPVKKNKPKEYPQQRETKTVAKHAMNEVCL